MKRKSGKTSQGTSPHSYWIFFITLIIVAVIFKQFYFNIVGFFIEKNWLLSNSYNPFDFAHVDNLFLYNFIEWFGVVYGFLVPLIMVRVWEQFDTLEREFDKEADAVKILFEDVKLLDGRNHSTLKKHIFNQLISYIKHVEDNYIIENDPGEESKKIRANGNFILKEIRKDYYDIVHSQKILRKERDPLLSELLTQLNNIIDARGDRIALAKQRLFDSLRGVTKIASVIWLIPFYLLRYDVSPEGATTPIYIGPGVIGNILIVGVTFLVVFVLTVIEDLDEPFGGHWKLDITPWNQMRSELEEALNQLDQ
jgi:hypothetical protein